MMTNEMTYKIEINTVDDYRISIKEFENWLIENETKKNFLKHCLNSVYYNDYDIAVDFSIPIILVKYLRKSL